MARWIAEARRTGAISAAEASGARRLAKAFGLYFNSSFDEKRFEHYLAGLFNE
jgi:hypothetical protein